jgi:hypothetical protein
MSKKIALFGFNGNLMCFSHALLNAMDMTARGFDVKLVLEGASVELVKDLVDRDKPFGQMFCQAMEDGLIDGACEACSNSLGVREHVQQAGLRLLGDMHGHPSMAGYIEQGYEVIVF